MMAAPEIGDDGLVFENRPLSSTIFQSIPVEVGFMKTAVVYTCMEANEDYIVLGSEQGYVWVVDLETSRLVREYNEFRGASVTAVKLCPTRDLLAYGTNDGYVRIEKITRPMANKWRVQEKDKQSVSCLEWSQTGDELFCGFVLGRVIQLRVNIHDNTLSPMTFPEGYASQVTQLSSRGHTVLISTVERAWIVDTQTHKLEQVGRKDRKPGQYGGCLVKGGEKIYVARPGLRLWSADSSGKVLRTCVFKEILSTQHLPQIPLQSWSCISPSYNKAWQFSSVLPWVGEHLVVTMSGHTLFVLDPEKGLVVGVLSLGHPIAAFVVTRVFVYILSNDLKKPICRISVNKLFLKALQKTLPLSPAISPSLSHTRKLSPHEKETDTRVPHLTPTEAVKGTPGENLSETLVNEESEGSQLTSIHQESLISDEPKTENSKIPATVSPDGDQTLVEGNIQEELTTTVHDSDNTLVDPEEPTTDLLSQVNLGPSVIDHTEGSVGESATDMLTFPSTENDLSQLVRETELSKLERNGGAQITRETEVSKLERNGGGQVGENETLLGQAAQLDNFGETSEQNLKEKVFGDNCESTPVNSTETGDKMLLLSDIVDQPSITAVDDTEKVQSSSNANTEPLKETETDNGNSNFSLESQTEISDKSTTELEQVTFQEALSTMKAEMRVLFKPKFDKISNILKVASPGALNLARLPGKAGQGASNEKDSTEEREDDKMSKNVDTQTSNDTPSKVSGSNEEKTEQEQIRKTDFKDILKLGRISNLLNKESSGISVATPLLGTPQTPIVVVPAPLDPLEQQRRLRMAQAKSEDEDGIVLKAKSPHKKKKRRRHKKLSSATSSVSVSLEQLTEIDEEMDSPTPLSAIATPISQSPSSSQPLFLTDEQRAKLETIIQERNADIESKGSDGDQTFLHNLTENQNELETEVGKSQTESESVDRIVSVGEADRITVEVLLTSNQTVSAADSPAPHLVTIGTEESLFEPSADGGLGSIFDTVEPEDGSIHSTDLFHHLPDTFSRKNSVPLPLDFFSDETPDDVLFSKSHSPGGYDSTVDSQEKSMTTTLGDLSDNPLYHNSCDEFVDSQQLSNEEATSVPGPTLHANARSKNKPSLFQPANFDPLQTDEMFEDQSNAADERNNLFAVTPVSFRLRSPSDSPQLLTRKRQHRSLPVTSGSLAGYEATRQQREGSTEGSDSSHEEEESDVTLVDSQVAPDFYQLCGSLVRNSHLHKQVKHNPTARFSWANSTFQQQASIIDESEEAEESGSNADIWTPILHPGRNHLQCICLSDLLLWVVDSRGNVFCTATENKGRDWQLIKKNMLQISSSPSGKIVWGMSHYNAYVRLGIGMNPAGSNWRNITKGSFLARKIKYLNVNEGNVWAITTDNKVVFRKGVDEGNPAGQVWKEVSGDGFTHIASCKNIVWAHTNQGKIFIRDGVTPSTPSGKSWTDVKCPKLTAACITNAGIAWGINNDGSIGFRCGVCSDKPAGKGPWWEIKINALTHPSSPYNSFWEVMSAEGGHLLTSVTSLLPHQSHHAKLLSLSASSKAGVVVLQDGNRLHACWRSTTGYHYKPASKNGIFSLTSWSKLSAGGTGLWLVRDDGDLYCLTIQDHLKRIECPAAVSLVASSPTCLWIVTKDLVWSRQGLSQDLPEGVSFDYIEVSARLHERKICSIACGKTAVWALDGSGVPHFRFGVHSREPGTGMSPAWISVDESPHSFVKIAVCPDNWLVWACDDKDNAYVRTGVTHDFPIGRAWEPVPCEQIKEVCVTNDKVYGLTPSGELLCRYGISEENVQGNYWRRMPGRYEHITTGVFGELWTLDSKGQVWKQEWKILTVSHDSRVGQSDFEVSMVVDQSWEVV